MHEHEEESSEVDDDGIFIVDLCEIGCDRRESIHQNGSHHLSKDELEYDEESLRIDFELSLRCKRLHLR